jgi:hypothetical protein
MNGFAPLWVLMYAQVSAPTEPLATLATDERPRSAVGSLVCAQVTALTEPLLALTTYERLCPTVDALMCAQGTAPTEPLATLATYERSRPAAGELALMSAQITAVSECLVAMIAHEPVPRTSSFSL